MKEPEDFIDCAERLKALADPDRLRIVNCLFAGPQHVGEIATSLGEEIVKVSHHLGILRRAKILKAEKQGRHVQYSLHPSVTVESLTPRAEPKSTDASLPMTDSASEQRCINFGCCRIDLEGS